MFPGSPRARHNVRVISLGAVSNITLGADDPDFIIIEVFNTAFSTSKIQLPQTAAIGKVFKFALVADPINDSTLTTQYIDIIAPLFKSSGVVDSWRMFSGQRPEFCYGPTGWISLACGGLSNTTVLNGRDIAFGNNANGSSQGVAVGRNTNGSSSGVAVGDRANGSSSGIAVGPVANGSSNGAAVGYNCNGSSNGAALGYQANGSSNGAALGYQASTNSKDAAVALGYNSKAQRYGELVKSADKASVTLQSWSMVDWYGDTANATPTEILLGGTANQRCVLLNNSAFMFSMQVIAAITGAGDTSSWTITGAIKRGANAASTVLVGTPTVTMTGQDGGAAAWAVAVTADTTNGSLNVTVTGEAAKTIRWNATATLSEVRF